MSKTLLDYILGGPEAESPVPIRRELYVRRFLSISRLVVKTYFARLDIDSSQLQIEDTTGPILFYSNHPSYWDPLILGLVVSELAANHSIYAPIEDQQLQRLWFFRGLGFFPLEINSVRGLKSFLKISRAILGNVKKPCLILTAEGRFSDPKSRPIRLKRGLSQLLSQSRTNAPKVFPLAIEYVKSKNMRPEAWVTLGSRVDTETDDSDSLHRHLERALEKTMDYNSERIRSLCSAHNLLNSSPS